MFFYLFIILLLQNAANAACGAFSHRSCVPYVTWYTVQDTEQEKWERKETQAETWRKTRNSELNKLKFSVERIPSQIRNPARTLFPVLFAFIIEIGACDLSPQAAFFYK